MKKLALALNLVFGLTAACFSATHVQEGSSFVVGQCLQAGSGDTASTTGAACGSGGTGSGIVSPGTFTWVNNFGIQVSTFVSNSTYTINGPMIASGTVGTAGQILASQGPGQPPTFIDPVVSQSTYSLLNAAVRVVDNNGVILGTSTTNPFYTYTANPSTAPITVNISTGPGPGGSLLTLSGRVSPVTIGTLKNSTDTVTVYVSSYSNVTFQIAPGTSTGIVANFEASIDSGINWIPTQSNRLNTFNVENSFTLDTSTNVWTASIIGMTNFRVRSSAWTTGIATVTIQVTGDPVSQTVSVGQPNAASLNATVSINVSSNTVKTTLLNIATVTFASGQSVTSTATFIVNQPTVTVSNVSLTVTPGTGTWNSVVVNIPTTTISGDVVLRSTGVFLVNTASITFNGSVQPVVLLSTGVFIVNQPTVTISGNSSFSLINTATVTFASGQPVTSTYTVVVASNIYNNTLSPATTGLTILSADEIGRNLVTGIPRGQIRQTTATIITNTEQLFISSGAAGVFNDLCGCIFANNSAVITRVDLRGQGTGGNINNAFVIPASETRGFWPGCQNPFIQLNSATNWTIQLSTAVTDMRANCQYIPIK